MEQEKTKVIVGQGTTQIVVPLSELAKGPAYVNEKIREVKAAWKAEEPTAK